MKDVDNPRQITERPVRSTLRLVGIGTGCLLALVAVGLFLIIDLSVSTGVSSSFFLSVSGAWLRSFQTAVVIALVLSSYGASRLLRKDSKSGVKGFLVWLVGAGVVGGMYFGICSYVSAVQGPEYFYTRDHQCRSLAAMGLARLLNPVLPPEIQEAVFESQDVCRALRLDDVIMHDQSGPCPEGSKASKSACYKALLKGINEHAPLMSGGLIMTLSTGVMLVIDLKRNGLSKLEAALELMEFLALHFEALDSRYLAELGRQFKGSKVFLPSDPIHRIIGETVDWKFGQSLVERGKQMAASTRAEIQSDRNLSSKKRHDYFLRIDRIESVIKKTSADWELIGQQLKGKIRAFDKDTRTKAGLESVLCKTSGEKVGCL